MFILQRYELVKAGIQTVDYQKQNYIIVGNWIYYKEKNVYHPYGSYFVNQDKDVFEYIEIRTYTPTQHSVNITRTKEEYCFDENINLFKFMKNKIDELIKSDKEFMEWHSKIWDELGITEE